MFHPKCPTAIAAVVFLTCAMFPQHARALLLAGEFVTYNQQDWGSVSTPASELLAANLDTLYPNGVEVGIPGLAGSSVLFTTIESLLTYLPQGGVPGPLDNDYLNPSTTSSGQFGGYVLALRFDVDFNDAGPLTGTASVPFGDLVLFGLTATPAYNGMNVREFLAVMNTALGGGSIAYDFDSMANLTSEMTLAFEGGTPSQFAQDHLMVVPEPVIAVLAVIALVALACRRVAARNQQVFGGGAGN